MSELKGGQCAAQLGQGGCTEGCQDGVALHCVGERHGLKTFSLKFKKVMSYINFTP